MSLTLVQHCINILRSLGLHRANTTKSKGEWTVAYCQKQLLRFAQQHTNALILHCKLEKTVTVYFSSEQSQVFGFAVQYCFQLAMNIP